MRLKYIDIIDGILSRSDLAQVTEKKIRTGIQDQVEYDITPQKVGLGRGSGDNKYEANRQGGNQRSDHATV